MEKCSKCGYKNSLYCVICNNYDMYTTEEDKKHIEALCELYCGEIEED